MTESLKEEQLLWQGAMRMIQNRIFKIRTLNGHGTGFYIGNFGKEDELIAIATAYHVIQGAHDWGQSIKLLHEQSGIEFLLEEFQRAILVEVQDLAIILFDKSTVPDLIINANDMSLIPSGTYIVPGVEVGWCGFPSVRRDKLCFFHGYVSCYLDDDKDYLIDGVAINGVSGGPVFCINNENFAPEILGVITSYYVNRATGEALPGLSKATSISHYQQTLERLQSLKDAKEEEGEQNKAPQGLD